MISLPKLSPAIMQPGATLSFLPENSGKQRRNSQRHAVLSVAELRAVEDFRRETGDRWLIILCRTAKTASGASSPAAEGDFTTSAEGGENCSGCPWTPAFAGATITNCDAGLHLSRARRVQRLCQRGIRGVKEDRRACKSRAKTGGREFTRAFGIADKPAALSTVAERVGIELVC